MELLIIRHGESLLNTKDTKNLDSMLSTKGIAQTCDTAMWIKKNIDIKDGWRGITSPYYRTLQTASSISILTEVPFFVNDLVKEYIPEIHFNREDISSEHITHEGKRGIFIENRSLLFQNILWDKFWTGTGKKFFIKENIDEFIKRMDFFLNVLPEGKWIIVSHGTVCTYITEHFDKMPKDQIIKEKLSGRTGCPNCSMTWVKNGEVKLKYKIVY